MDRARDMRLTQIHEEQQASLTDSHTIMDNVLPQQRHVCAAVIRTPQTAFVSLLISAVALHLFIGRLLLNSICDCKAHVLQFYFIDEKKLIAQTVLF